MIIQFKNLGSSGMDLKKDSEGLIWIELTDSVTTQKMPLTGNDIRNLISTLNYLQSLQPAGAFEDSFPSQTITVSGNTEIMAHPIYNGVRVSESAFAINSPSNI